MCKLRPVPKFAATLAAMLAISIGCPLADAGSPQASQKLVTLSQGETLWLTAAGLRLKTKIFQSAKLSERPVLILVLHGDSPFGPPSYQYLFAARAAAQMDDVTVAALLRPGYCDGTGDCSAGERGLTTGDNYTPEVVGAVTGVIEQLTAKYHTSTAIVAGHSGGAAISADLIGKSPSVVNGALLVSCPCDLEAWRKHMYEMQKNDPIWLKPIHSLSPMDLAKDVPPRMRVRIVAGSGDAVAPPNLTKEYADALREHGVDVTVTIAPGLEHNILLEPLIFEQLKLLVEAIEQDAKR